MATAARNRSTKAAIAKREDDIIRLLSIKDMVATAKEIAFATGATYAAVAATLARLVQEGKIIKKEYNGNQILYALNRLDDNDKILHQNVEVIGLHKTNDEPIVDLRQANGDVLHAILI
jgi:hypothetical protein